MDITQENMSPMEMLEKIAELDYSQSQLKDLNAEMSHWLEVADDDMETLRSENDALRKQVKNLQKMISEAQETETEPCRSLQAEDVDIKRDGEQKIQMLENESAVLKEENKKITAELKSLEEEREQEKEKLNKFRAALQNLECENEEAQLGLQHRDEIIHQKNLQLKDLKNTVEECSNIIKDLRLRNQELREQLEEKLDEASFTAQNDLVRVKEGTLSPPLSFAEEMKLVAATESTDLTDEETENLLKPQSLAVDLQTKRCAAALKISIQRAGLFMLVIFTLTVLVFVASGVSAGNSGIFSFNTLWTGASLVLQPYCGVHYGALPPV